MTDIKLFAYLAETLGATIKVQLPKTFTKSQLLETVAQAFPLMKNEIMTCNVAINQTFATEGQVYEVAEIKEIALIPPVSGG